MESAKLTLSIPKGLLAEAKLYSKRTKQPLSRLVGHYFSVLARTCKKKGIADHISENARKATGLAKSEKDEDTLLYESLKDKHL